MYAIIYITFLRIVLFDMYMQAVGSIFIWVSAQSLLKTMFNAVIKSKADYICSPTHRGGFMLLGQTMRILY